MMEPALGMGLNRAQSTSSTYQLNAGTNHRATSLSADVSDSQTPMLQYQSTRTPPPNIAPMAPLTHNQSMFEFPNPINPHNDPMAGTMGGTMSRDNSMSPTLGGFGGDSLFATNPNGNGNESLFISNMDRMHLSNGHDSRSGPNSKHKNSKNSNHKNTIDLSNDQSSEYCSVLRPNVTLGATRLTRLSLSKLMYFLDYTMYRRAKYKGDPERYFPLHDVLHAVKNWDATYDLIDVERVYMHWMKRRRQNGGIQEKALIRAFQEPPDTNDDDNNIAFRPRTSDERHVATRRQTKKPKKNTLDSYLRLKSLRDNLQKTCCYLRKLKEMEEVKKRMALKAIEERQNRIIHSSPYIRSKAAEMDSMDTLDANHAALFGTFSSSILQRESVRSWMGVKALTVDDLNSMSNHFKDVVTFRKKWETVCNRTAVAKTDGVVDAVKEQFGHFTPRYTDRVIQQLFPKELKPLSTENMMRLPKVREFELNENRPFHWELPADSTNPMKLNKDYKMKKGKMKGDYKEGEEVNADGKTQGTEDEFMYEKEREIMEGIRKQRGNTVQQRMVDSICGDTFIQYRYPDNNNKVMSNNKKKDGEDHEVGMESMTEKDLCPVAVPKISRDGALQIAVYHPMVETTDHVEYEPTRLVGSGQTDTVFDEFQIPMEPTIALYSARKGKVSKQRSGIGRKRKHRAVSQSPPHLHQTHKLHLNCGMPPAPKRQKLLHSTSHVGNGSLVPSAAIPLVATASAPSTNTNSTNNGNTNTKNKVNGSGMGGTGGVGAPLALKKGSSSNAVSGVSVSASSGPSSSSNGSGPITTKNLLAVGKRTKSAASKSAALSTTSLSMLQRDKHRQRYMELQQNSKLRTVNANNSSTTSAVSASATSSTAQSTFSSLTALTATKSTPSASASKSNKKRPSSYKLPHSLLNATTDSVAPSTASKRKKKEKSSKKKKKEKSSRDSKDSKKKEKSKKKEPKSSKKRNSKTAAASSQKNTISTYPGFGANGTKKDNSKSSKTGTKSAKSSTKSSKSTAPNAPLSNSLSNGLSNGNDHGKSNGHSLQQQLSSTVSTSDATSTISNISSGCFTIPRASAQSVLPLRAPPRASSLPPPVSLKTLSLRSISPLLHFPFDTLSMGTFRKYFDILH